MNEMELNFRLTNDGRLAVLGLPGHLPDSRRPPETGPDAHNCDQMGCPSAGPHVVAYIRMSVEAEKMLRRFVKGPTP